jgi:hypothetical protein
MPWAAATAILLVIVLFYLNRRVAAIVLAVAVIVGGVLWVVTERQTKERTARKEAVAATAAVNMEACPDPSRPIMVEFQNQSDQTVERLSFELAGRLRGHSSISYRAFLRDDKIISPGQSSMTCYGVLPHGFSSAGRDSDDPSDYEWSVRISLVSFSP